MISKEENNHQKHAKLKRPQIGHFGRNELAILGTPCGNIKQMVRNLVSSLDDVGPLGFVDADHKAAEPEEQQEVIFTDKISFRRFDFKQDLNSFQLRPQFNLCQLVLVNGNHFKAAHQVLVIDPKKPLDRKLDRITNPVLVVKKSPDVEIPGYLDSYINDLPVLEWEQGAEIAAFVRQWLSRRISGIRGLVLAGGKSVRMKQDKGALVYHGVSQRQYVYDQLKRSGVEPVISCRPEQADEIETGLSTLPDFFRGLGPMGAILTALKEDPDSAWLAIACDLPYLTQPTIDYLIEHRDTTKIATAFKSPYDEFPEPLITIWEPRSYGVLLNFLSQGYSCPRKVLINSEIAQLTAPNPRDLSNVNHPEEYQSAIQDLRAKV